MPADVIIWNPAYKIKRKDISYKPLNLVTDWNPEDPSNKIIHNMLKIIPSERLNCNELLNDSYFDDIRDDNVINYKYINKNTNYNFSKKMLLKVPIGRLWKD